MKKFLIILFSVLLIALVVVGIYIFNLFNTFEQGVTDSYESTDRDRSELRSDDIDTDLDSFTVLIMGIDASEGRMEKEDSPETQNDYRTDTMILATFNQDDDEIKMISIPRDTLAYFPDENYYDKITHAHRNNGPESAMLATESLLNVPVDYYARVNMNALVDVVDAIGGVEFDVPFDMEEPTTEDRGTIEIEEGEQTLNGDEALAVVRSREVDTDLGRGNRQLEMVEAIMDKAKSTGALTNIDDLIDVVADNARHDLESDTIRSLAAYYAFNDVEFVTTQISGTDYWHQPNGAYFYDADNEHLFALSNTVRDVLGLEPSEPYDLINIRLAGHITPYQYLDDYMLEEYEPEMESPMSAPDYENPFEDAFDIPDFDHEDSDVEGEEGGGIENGGEQQPQQEEQQPQPEEQQPQQEEEQPQEPGQNEGYNDSTNEGTGGGTYY